MWDKIANHISQIIEADFIIKDRRSVSGGCINQGYRLTDGSRDYFVKLNQASLVAMFEAEMLGVQQMYSTQTIRVPQPLCYGIAENSAYIVLEWLEMGGGSNRLAMVEMGRKLAQLHQWQPDQDDPGYSQFGWEINNTIGSTPQINTWTENWTEFWIEHRIKYQLKLAKKRGKTFNQAEQLINKIPEILENYYPKPSLVHGDLWGGNASVTADGEPVIFDPAAYFGDREVDIAMTELFGSFSAAFYQGYQEFWPLESGYERRKTLYNLYHILNHFNLFGGGYALQAERMMQQLL